MASAVHAFIKELRQKADTRSDKGAALSLAKNECMAARLETISRRFASRTWVPQYKGKKTKRTERWLNLMLSDLHFGSELDGRVVDYPYGSLEESRRLGAVVAQAADYKRRYRKETSLAVHLLGDIIEGNIHDPQASSNLTVQYDRSLHHLIHALEFLATEFKQVIVRTSVGNHGRDISRHPDRAMQDKYDSHEFRIYRALYHSFRRVSNVQVETPVRPYYVCSQFGQKALYTHGDTIFNFGNPGKLIRTANLEAQIGRFRTAQQDNSDVTLFCGAHVHVSSDVDVASATVITNGALLPGGQFAQAIGCFASSCSQQLWESVEGHQFGDHRRLYVDGTTDTTREFDKIIPPWKALP
jgi:hypothetical protein